METQLDSCPKLLNLKVDAQAKKVCAQIDWQYAGDNES